MELNEILDPFARLLDEVAAPAIVREAEDGASIGALWAEFERSGYLDALVAEDAGGSGLSLEIGGALMRAIGNRGVPAPVAETMVARALLASAGQEVPAGPIALAAIESGEVCAVPMALVADHILLATGATVTLAPASSIEVVPTGVAGSQAAHVRADSPAGASFQMPEGGLRSVAAVVRASLIAGACDRLLQLTVDYANERVQFGKPIGKLQAIQQQIAVMAELTVSSRIAAQIGCSAGFPPTLAAAAVAKQMTSSAAAEIANIAHAVHGAIGISEEYDLQLFSRRVHEWRLAEGSGSYWAGRLGGDRLAARESSIDFVRERIGHKEIT